MRKIIKWLLPKPEERITGEEKFICNLEKDPEDERDYFVKATPVQVLPSRVSLRKYCKGLVKSQGRIGSCGSHAFATALEIMLRKDKPSWFIETSELFHYYVVRDKDFMGTLPRDSGQYLRDGARVLKKIGISPESLCPYDYRKFNEKPGIFAYGFARWWKIKSYQKCYDIQSIKSELAEGNPVVFGVGVTKSFLRNRNGEIKEIQNDPYAGGHAMVFIGYDEDKQAFELINSWGTLWGKNGYAWMPYGWFQKRFLDAWTIYI